MSTRMNIAVRGLFATPVAALEAAGTARDRGIERCHPEQAPRRPSPFSYGNSGGWHSDREIADWGGPQVAFILDLAKEMANRLTADRNGN